MTPPKYVAIVGSRNFPDLAKVREYVMALEPGTVVVSGGARGVDKTAADTARERGLEVEEFLPKYGKYGMQAPVLRNEQIVKRADRVVAFWFGNSKGTAHAVGYAKRTGKPLEVIR